MIFGYEDEQVYLFGFLVVVGLFFIFVIFVIGQWIYSKFFKELKEDKELRLKKLKLEKDKLEKLEKQKIKTVKIKTIDKKADKTIIDTDSYDVTKKGFFDLSRYKNKYLKSFRASTVLMINMELSNGIFRSFLIREKEGGFTYNKQHYILDNESKYYNMDARVWAYDFHERFTLPIKKQLPVKDIKKALIGTEAEEVEYSANPSVLKHFITSKIAEGIMKGQALDSWLKQVRILIFFTLIVVTIHAVLYMQRQGFFQQITGSLGIG